MTESIRLSADDVRQLRDVAERIARRHSSAHRFAIEIAERFSLTTGNAALNIRAISTDPDWADTDLNQTFPWSRILISANALSRWDRHEGYARWMGWNLRSLANASRLVSIDLDSAGFVVAQRYRGLPWTTDDYIELAASYPFRRFASLDLCTEEEIARDRDEVLDRISRTVALNHACHARAADRGIDTRFMPVIQGRHPDDYLRCLDGIAGILRPGMVVGIGSMCRRALSGPDGLLAVLSRLDRGADPALRFHLFGVKGTALRYLRPLAHRVTSLDSCAYSLAARIEAWREGFSKTDEFVAGHMERWQRRQQARLDGGDAAFQHHLPLAQRPPSAGNEWERALDLARAEIRILIEQGEIAHEQITEGWIVQWASETYDARQ